MKSVAYHRLAASELIESAKFYERRNSTLGDAVLSAVEATLTKIQCNPELGRHGKLGSRSWNTKRFYRLTFALMGDPFTIFQLDAPPLPAENTRQLTETT